MKCSILLILTFICLSLSSCSNPPGVYHSVANAIKTDFNFKTGSYWIFRDSLTGQIDSFFVTSNKDSSRLISSGSRYEPTITDELIFISISEVTISPVFKVDSPSWYYLYETSEIDLRGIVGYPQFFYYQISDSFSSNEYNELGVDTGIVNGVLATYQFNGLSFTHVAIINHYDSFISGGPAALPPYSYNDLFYVCPGIGIIKMRLNHPQDSVYRVWEVQRWNIIK